VPAYPRSRHQAHHLNHATRPPEQVQNKGSTGLKIKSSKRFAIERPEPLTSLARVSLPPVFWNCFFKVSLVACTTHLLSSIALSQTRTLSLSRTPGPYHPSPTSLAAVPSMSKSQVYQSPIDKYAKVPSTKEKCYFVTCVTKAGICTVSFPPSLPFQLRCGNAPHVSPLLPHPRLPFDTSTSPLPFFTLTRIKYRLKNEKNLCHFSKVITSYNNTLPSQLPKKKNPLFPPLAPRTET